MDSQLPPVRRVVAGHSKGGESIVQSDTQIYSQCPNAAGCKGLLSGGLWTTDRVPSTDTNHHIDGATRHIDGNGLILRNGTNLRFTDLAPDGFAPMHRTSSVDYNILVKGRLILVLDDGSETLLDQPGATVIMKGNMHAWRNPGPEWARWVSVLIDAEPAVVNGKKLKDAWEA